MIYKYINLEIKKVENIKEVLNYSIDDKMDFIEEIENIEECKTAFIDFMLEVRTQMNLLTGAIDDLNEINTNLILNNSNSEDEENIKPYSDMKFKKNLLKFRY